MPEIGKLFVRRKEPAMTKRKTKAAVGEIKRQLGQDDTFIREGVRGYLREVLETEMTQALGMAKSERTDTRRGYRSGVVPTRRVTTVSWNRFSNVGAAS